MGDIHGISSSFEGVKAWDIMSVLIRQSMEIVETQTYNWSFIAGKSSKQVADLTGHPRLISRG